MQKLCIAALLTFGLLGSADAHTRFCPGQSGINDTSPCSGPASKDTKKSGGKKSGPAKPSKGDRAK